MSEQRQPNGPSSGDESDRSNVNQPGWTASNGSLADNLVFASVDSPRRRFILEALREEDGEVTIDQLVEDVASIERAVDKSEPTGDHDELLAEIYDAELPELTDIGIVDFDESNGLVELGPYADELDLESFTSDTD